MSKISKHIRRKYQLFPAEKGGADLKVASADERNLRLQLVVTHNVTNMLKITQLCTLQGLGNLNY